MPEEQAFDGKHVVLLGAGHAHVGVLHAFGSKPLAGAHLTLITRAVQTLYSGMLPGLVAGAYSAADAHIDIARLAAFAGADLLVDEAVGLDLERKRVMCRDRPPVPFDVLSIDIGSQPNTTDVPGALSDAIPVKPIDGFLQRFEAIRRDVVARQGRAHIALVGAGAAGVELLLAVHRRLRDDVSRAGGDPDALSFTLVAAGPEILPEFPPRARAALRAILVSRGIVVRTNARVTRVDVGRLILEQGGALDADHILWTTQASAAAWLKQTGLALSESGFVRVDENLRAQNRDDIFAAGDIAAFGPRALPRSGVYAVRAGPVLSRNIRATVHGRALSCYRPQRHVLYLLSTADGRAVGTRNGITFSGAWVWRWKDWIDRRFMARFRA